MRNIVIKRITLKKPIIILGQNLVGLGWLLNLPHWSHRGHLNWHGLSLKNQTNRLFLKYITCLYIVCKKIYHNRNINLSPARAITIAGCVSFLLAIVTMPMGITILCTYVQNKKNQIRATVDRNFRKCEFRTMQCEI